MVLPNAFAVPVMLSSVNAVLPVVAADIRLTALELSWVPTAFLMASSMFVLVFGRLADMWGRRKIFLFGAGTVVASSILASMASNGPELVFARFLQGFGAAMLYATQMALISSVFTKENRGQAISWLISLIYVGLAVGPLLGGVMNEYFGWRSVFYLQVPLGLFVLYVGTFRIRTEWSAENFGEFDYIGAFLYVFTIGLLCLGVSAIQSMLGYVLIFMSVVAGYLFFKFEAKKDSPLWDLSLFHKNRIFLSCCVASLIMYGATFMNVMLISLHLQYFKDMSPIPAAMIMVIQPTVMAICTPLVGRKFDHRNAGRYARTGMLLTTIGLFFLALHNAASSLALTAVALTITGLGFSLFSTPNATLLMGSVDNRDLGLASSATSTTRILGQLSSTAIVTLVFAVRIGGAEIIQDDIPLLSPAIQAAFFFAACLSLLGFVFVWSLNRKA
jgi:MFS family permease